MGLKAKPFTYTHLAAAGAGTGEVNLLRLPPGRLTIFSQLSRIEATQEAVNASKLLPGYSVHILGNYWFMIAATPAPGS